VANLSRLASLCPHNCADGPLRNIILRWRVSYLITSSGPKLRWKGSPRIDFFEYRSQLDECLANAQRTDNPQHKDALLRLAECYRVLIERAKQEAEEQA
jgi:hypothetical protein